MLFFPMFVLLYWINSIYRFKINKTINELKKKIVYLVGSMGEIWNHGPSKEVPGCLYRQQCLQNPPVITFERYIFFIIKFSSVINKSC